MKPRTTTVPLGMEYLVNHLDALVNPGVGHTYREAALAQITPDGQQHVWMFGAHSTQLPRIRCASISKAATAHAVLALTAQDRLSLRTEIAEVLPLDQVRFAGITVDMLLNHTSGLTDDAGYFFDPPHHLFDFVTNTTDKFLSGDPPGTFFRYANLNYVLLGHILEIVTDQRFDHVLTEHVFRPAGIHGGFNWANVPIEARQNRLPLYQRQNGAMTLQLDGTKGDWAADLIWRDGRGISLADYVPGTATGFFSPHGGLRANVVELALLAKLIGGDGPAARLQRTPTWRYDPKKRNGEDCDGLFRCFGRGATIYRDHPQISGHLVGHAGHAMGFTGGAWHNMDTGISWAYFLTGSEDVTDGQDNEVFYRPEELLILQAF